MKLSGHELTAKEIANEIEVNASGYPAKQELIDFCANQENVDKLESAGLSAKRAIGDGRIEIGSFEWNQVFDVVEESGIII